MDRRGIRYQFSELTVNLKKISSLGLLLPLSDANETTDEFDIVYGWFWDEVEDILPDLGWKIG